MSDLSRRSFLSGGLAAGGLVAVSSLPARAGDDGRALFAGRGDFERLTVGYHHVKAGVPQPFSILHISDTHLTAANPDEGGEMSDWAARRQRTFGGRQADALACSLAWAKDHVDYVLHTGDLIDFQSKANCELVRACYGATANLFGTTGNHEYQRSPGARGIRNTAAYNAASREALNAAFGCDTLFSSTVVRGVNFVRLDNSYGTVTAEQAAKFEAEAKKGLPIVLCQHAPFYTPEIWLATGKFWSNRGAFFRTADAGAPEGDYARQNGDRTTQDFIRMLKAEPLLKAILAGHLHIDVADRFSPTAMEYVVGGNFLYHGNEILIS